MAAPKIRFKQDDGREFPDWSDVRFGDVFSEVIRKTSDTITYPLYSLTIENGVTEKTERYERSHLVKKSEDNYKIVPPKAFVYNPMNLRFGALAPSHEDKEISVSQYYNVFTLRDERTLAFWENYLVTKAMLQYYFSIATGSLIEKLRVHYSAFVNIVKKIPCVEEQCKIADFLTSVDEVISASEQEVVNLETQKKAVMKKIFSQEVRFKRADGTDFPEWEEKRIGDICKTYSGGTPKVGNDGYYGGNIPFIRSGEIHSDSTELFLTEEGMKNSSAKMVAVGDIIMALYGATSGEIDISKIEGAINQAILCIKPEDGFDRKFVVEVFRNYKDDILKTYLQGGQGNLSAQIVQGLSFEFPCLEEQHLIADFLSDFDEAIAAAKKELELWKELKKGLLQQMFV